MTDIFNMADTWNSGGTTFEAIRMDVTDTASAAGSLLMNLLVGGVSKLSVNKSGYLAGSSDTDLFNSTTTRVNGALKVQGSIISLGDPGSAGFLLEFANQNKVVCGSGGLYTWSSSATATPSTLRTNVDTGMARNAAGVVEINNGTAGTLRDLKARKASLTGLPTSSSGLASGDLWSNSGVVNVIP